MERFHSLVFALVFVFFSSLAAATGTVNINTAKASVLAELLSGVGPEKAAAIVAYRDQHGPFQSVRELAKVSGIGDKTIEKNRQLLSIE